MIETARKRPVWVWVIAICCLVHVAFGLLFYALLFSGVHFISATMAKSLAIWTWFDYVSIVLDYIFNLGGAITIFLLRKQALFFFSGVLVVTVASMIWHASSKVYLQNSGPSWVLIMIDLLINLAVCLYCWRLTKTAVLQ